jgi:hypothetical protein
MNNFETLSVLFTDAVASTALADRVGPDRVGPAARPPRTARAVLATSRGFGSVGPMLSWRWLYYSANRALLSGDLERAFALARESGEVGIAAGERHAQPFRVALQSFVNWEQGQLGTAVEYLESAIDSFPGFTIFRPLHALALCEADRTDEAAALLAEVAADQFGSIPSNALWTTAMLTWSHVAARVEDREAAALLYERLAPFADQVAVTPIGAPGAIAHGLGLLAATRDRGRRRAFRCCGRDP